MAAEGAGREGVAPAARALDQRALAVEAELFDVNLTGAREDQFRNPIRLYGRLSALASDVTANGADFAPTAQQLEVWAGFRAQAQALRARTDALFAADVPALDARLRRRGLPPLAAAPR